MSKKATHVRAAPQPQAQAAATAAPLADAVVRAPAAESAEARRGEHLDEHRGQGGHCEMRAGRRVLVQRTEPQA